MGRPDGIDCQHDIRSVPRPILVSTGTRVKGLDQSAQPDEAHSITVDSKGEVAQPLNPASTHIKTGGIPRIQKLESQDINQIRLSI